MSDTVRVSYRNLEGVHVFSSDDVAGFYVANRDLNEAYACVSAGLRELHRANTGEDVAFEAAMPFEDFKRFLGESDGPSSLHPAVIAARGVAFRSRVTGHGDDD